MAWLIADDVHRWMIYESINFELEFVLSLFFPLSLQISSAASGRRGIDNLTASPQLPGFARHIWFTPLAWQIALFTLHLQSPLISSEMSTGKSCLKTCNNRKKLKVIWHRFTFRFSLAISAIVQTDLCFWISSRSIIDSVRWDHRSCTRKSDGMWARNGRWFRFLRRQLLAVYRFKVDCS